MKTYEFTTKEGKDVEVAIKTTLTHRNKVTGFNGDVTIDNKTYSGEFSLRSNFEHHHNITEVDFTEIINKHLTETP